MKTAYTSNKALGMTLALFFAALTLSAVTPGYSFAATYYVDQSNPSASDSNPGTEPLPWKTLYKAAATLVAGDTVLVKQGTYDARSGCAWNRPSINPVNSGTPGNPIAFRAYSGHTVVLDNGSTFDCPAIGSRDRNHIIIDGFTIPHPSNRGILVWGASGVIVENNTIHGLRGVGGDNTDGIRIENVTTSIIRNNLIFDIRNESLNGNDAGVKMYSVDNTILENNEIHGASAGLYDKSGGVSNTFRRNYVHDMIGDRRCIGLGSGVAAIGDKVYENILVGCNKAVDTDAAANIEIFNNTFVSYTGSALNGPEDGVINLRAWNNIFYRPSNTAGNDFHTYDDPPTSLALSDFNLYYTTLSEAREPEILVGRNSSSRTFTTLSGWQNAYGRDLQSRVADPLFVDPQNGDFRLAPGSPALGAGRVGGVSTGAVVNVGAYTTGSERIGLARDVARDTVPPSPPSGLAVR